MPKTPTVQKKILRSVGPMNGIYQKLLKFYLPNRSSQADRDLKNINETQKLLHQSKTATSYLKLLHPNPSPRLIETSNCYIQTQTATSNIKKLLLTKKSRNPKKSYERSLKKHVKIKSQKGQKFTK